MFAVRLFLLSLLLTTLCSATPHRRHLQKRAGLPSTRPKYASPTTYPISSGAQGTNIFAWQSKTPSDQSQTQKVYISMHGVARDADVYFTAINQAYVAARKAGLPGAQGSVLRVAPLFFDADADANKLNDTTLAWGQDNDWAAAAVSQHPESAGISSMSVLDQLVQRFSNQQSFPNVQSITFVGHGGGALLLQRYATLRPQSADDGRVALRYVVANPSTFLYLTTDRPSPVDTDTCDYYNDFYYGLDSYDIPYTADIDSPSSLFKTYVGRDVRYVVGLKDVSSVDGDQSCGARAMGGDYRKDRTLAFWKYINLLAYGAGRQTTASMSSFPGNFSDIQSGNTDTTDFRTDNFKHTLTQIKSVGHDATQIMTSKPGMRAIFGN